MTEPTQDDELPPEVANLHPFIITLFGLLTPGKDGERFDLAEDHVHELYAGLLEYENDDELAHIVHGLTAMAIAMREELNSPSLSNQIVAILDDDKIGRMLTSLKVSQDPEALNAAAKAFESFADRDAKKAPMANEPRPEGTVTLDGLKFPRRL